MSDKTKKQISAGQATEKANQPEKQQQKDKKPKEKSTKSKRGGGKKQQVPVPSTLDLGAPVFVPFNQTSANAAPLITTGAFVLPSLQAVDTTAAAKVFNLDAPVFKPKSSGTSMGMPGLMMSPALPAFVPLIPGGPSQSPYSQPYPQHQSLPAFIPTNPLGVDPMNGYKNPFLAKQAPQQRPSPSQAGSTANSTPVDTKQQAADSPKEQSRVYSIEFMLSLRTANKDRPSNMALLDFPHKKKRQMAINGVGKNQMTEADKFNFTVREIRILLNKLSKGNFENISKRILNDFQYTPSILKELMKIIFMKATTESTYLELYVHLCKLLFRKFNDKDNKEMNFRNLLLMKCQKQFLKLKAKEEQEKRSRRQSMDSNLSSHSNPDDDFNKQMLFVFDSEEIKFRQKLQQFGNMSLLVELYVQNHIQEQIIKICIETLMDDINDQRAEILCQMLQKIAAHVVKKSVHESHLLQSGQVIEKKKRLSECLINLEFIESILSKLFPYRSNPDLSSRVRFKIQDLIDLYQKEWKNVIYGERKVVDDEGFQYKYVPKEAIKIEQLEVPEKKGKGGRSRKTSNADPSSGPKGTTNMVYVRKQSAQETFMKSIIDGLKPDAETLPEARLPGKSDVRDLHSDDDENELDEDYRKILSRKVSMNEQNVLGTDLEKYNRDAKPSSDIRRKIANFAMEYKETKDRAHAKDSFLEVCKETNTPKSTFVGYILNNAFSLDLEGWKDFLELIIEHLYTQEKLLTDKDLLEGVHVSLANFIDTLIDYPKSREYAFEMFERLGSLGILKPEQIDTYKQHVANLEHYEDEEETAANE